MIPCPACRQANPDDARYCMRCGQALEAAAPRQRPGLRFDRRGSRLFLMTVAGSLLLSFILIFVFRLPIFILAGFLPFLWSYGRQR